MNTHIPTNSNPIYWREKRRLENSRPVRRLFRAVYIIYGIILGLITLAAFIQSSSIFRGFNWDRFIDFMFFATLVTVAIGQWLTLIFFVPPLTAGAISDERKNETFELLFLTPLTSEQIIFGKARASLPFALKIVFFIAPAFLILIPFFSFLGNLDREEWLEIIALMFAAQLLVLIMTVFVVLLTLYLSTVFRQTAVVIAATYGAIFAHFIASLILIILAEGEEYSFVVHPLLALFFVLDGIGSEMEAFSTSILCLTLYAGISYGLIHLTVSRVRGIAGRPAVKKPNKRSAKQAIQRQTDETPPHT